MTYPFLSKNFGECPINTLPYSSPKKDIGIQKDKKTPFGQEVSVI
jgi:hypothetical protein